MLCLALDASGPAASAAVVRGDHLLYETLLVRERAHAAHLAPMAAEALSRAGIAAAACDVIACACGPGSFTGVRIGVALAQGMAEAASVPCARVNALEAWAYPHRLCRDVICPVLDARAGQVYGAAFRDGARVLDDMAAPIGEFLAQVEPLGERFLFVGDGVGLHEAAIREFFGERAALDAHAALRASSAAFLALQRPDTWMDAAALRPIYLRAPQAERERAAREAAHG